MDRAIVAVALAVAVLIVVLLYRIAGDVEAIRERLAGRNDEESRNEG